MTCKNLSKLLATSLAVAATGPGLFAQSADALIDKLVEKGILTVGEAKTLREEADNGFNTAYSVKSGMPEWVESLKFSGDFRGRYDAITVETLDIADRNRFRYRLRFGAVAVMKNDLEAGVRLMSAEEPGDFSTGDPISGNTTFSDNGSKKGIFIDTAYGKWSPLHAGGWMGGITIGKMENPFEVSDITFDPDYTPEGAAATISYTLRDMHTFRLIAGGFMVDEFSSDSNDAYFYAAQGRVESKWSGKWQTSAGAGFFSLENSDNLVTSAIPDKNTGNTRTDDTALVHDYYPVVLDASATYTLDSFRFYRGQFPIRVFADYMNNPGAPGSQNQGYDAGITFGRAGKRGTWEFTYRYRYLESDAWFEEFVDSDIGATYTSAFPGGIVGYGAGTNVKGHALRAGYSPFDALTLNATYYLMDLVDEPDSSDTGSTRLLLDATFRF